MKNSDLPAMPASIDAEVAQKLGVDLSDPVQWQKAQQGLTKREMLAMHAMASWINHHGSAGNYGFSPKEAARSAVDCADALLAELEK